MCVRPCACARADAGPLILTQLNRADLISSETVRLASFLGFDAWAFLLASSSHNYLAPSPPLSPCLALVRWSVSGDSSAVTLPGNGFCDGEDASRR
jgi:hypothetical protein